MKIVITGSLGHISKPLTNKLVQQGHDVTVISSKSERQNEIQALGAKAAIGTLEDSSFLAETFKAQDVVYLMEPPINFFDKSIDMVKFYSGVAENYFRAVEQS